MKIRSIMASSTVKIRTAVAIDLLKDSIKTKKAELADLNKAIEKYKKDYDVWQEKTKKEALKAALSDASVSYYFYDFNKTSKVEIKFIFVPTSQPPLNPEKGEGPKVFEYSNQITQAERLLKMLSLTEDEFVSAAVYKDIASMI
jgi:predicted GTPase